MTRERDRRDRGATATEYLGVLVLLAALVGVLAISPIGTRLQSGVLAGICRITSGGGCADGGSSGGSGGPGDAAGSGAGSGTGSGAGADGGTGTGSAGGTGTGTGSDSCDGVLGCIVKYGGDTVAGAVGGLVDDVKGVIDLIGDPGKLLDAGKYIVEHPLDTVRQLFVDDETIDSWQAGDYAGAIGRTIWNVGSWFIPGYDIGKGVSKVGKLGAEAGKVSRLTRLIGLAGDAERAAARAEKAALVGDRVTAEAAAKEARRAADEAWDEATKAGCAIALPALVPGGGAHGTPVTATFLAAKRCKGDEEAAKAEEAAQRAQEAADRAGRPTTGPVPAPRTLPAFPDATRARPKTSVQGGGGLRPRWKDADGTIYEWDRQHGTVEKYDRRGRHLGEFDPNTGARTKPADPTRKVEP